AEVFGEDYEFLRKRQILTFDEIERLAAIFARLGVRKIKLTGGEPLLRPWLPDLVARLRKIEAIDDIALITNGSLLESMVRPLQRAGLHRLTVSLDSLDPETFARLNGRGHQLSQVLSALETAERAGFRPIKLNVVVQRGINDAEVTEFARRFRGTPYIVRFIEYMDVGNRNGWSREIVVPSREIRERIDAIYPLEPVDANYQGEVASRYRYRDGAGEIGFISSITQPFCRVCTRIRLSADGKLYTCLFARTGHDLRRMLRTGADDASIAAAIASIWGGREDRYSEQRAEESADVKDGLDPKVEMYHIGG
ncbi:GTP 3',8-cyclase MoaA, partial [Salinispira pacifica]